MGFKLALARTYAEPLRRLKSAVYPDSLRRGFVKTVYPANKITHSTKSPTDDK